MVNRHADHRYRTDWSGRVHVVDCGPNARHLWGSERQTSGNWVAFPTCPFTLKLDCYSVFILICDFPGDNDTTCKTNTVYRAVSEYLEAISDSVLWHTFTTVIILYVRINRINTLLFWKNNTSFPLGKFNSFTSTSGRMWMWGPQFSSVGEGDTGLSYTGLNVVCPVQFII